MIEFEKDIRTSQKKVKPVSDFAQKVTKFTV